MASAYYPGCPNADYSHWLKTGEVWPGQESAARGAQYRDDQPAGVDNSQQAAQGCRVAAGASDGLTDTCPLGTADSPFHPVFIPKALFAKAARELGYDVASLPREGEQRYFDWVGGGIRYWEGHRTMPNGR